MYNERVNERQHKVNKMTTKTESFKCETCVKLYETKPEAMSCEVKCHNKRIEAQKQQRMYREQVEKRLQEATEISLRHSGIRLLVEHKLYDSARLLCENATKFLWDCGTSRGWEDVYTQMIKVHNSSYIPWD